IEIDPSDPAWQSTVVLGIRLYTVEVEENFKKEIPMKSGKNQFFVYLVKGSDGKVRILGIGTGP
ncbi:MAG: DUF4829 domain-containing protein, partial [candidate division KSB1 bacterium]|nr:DUF4829 domain-containing protein [candidate division KSB1 bacterium]